MTEEPEHSPRRLKVAQFTDNYGPGSNGLMFAVQQLEGNLLDAGHEVVVVAPKAKGPNPHLGREGRVEVRLPSVRVPNMPTRVANGRHFERTIEQVGHLDPDVIHVHGLGTVGVLGTWAAKRLNKPMLMTWHTDFDAYADHYAAVLPLLHGPYGEDGTIQGMLEMMGIPYVGCGVLASAAGMDKQVTKVLLGAAGIATAPHVVVGPHAWKRDPEAILEACRSLTYPLFVKPARAGSSLGISKVDRPEDLAGAIEAARAVDPKVLVESGIVGREVEVAVLQGRGDDAPRVAEPGEIAMDASQGAGEFYDYETKYLAHDAVAMVCPAPIGPEARDLLMDTAARAFEALGCEGLARVDFFLTDAGEAVVNEINTMPGFTPFSMYPYMWQVSGLGYTELVSELIELAVARSTDVNR